MFEKAVILVLGALLGVLGYVLKRRYERRPTLEALDIKAKLLTINKEMKAQGLSHQDLSDLEKELTNKPQAVQKYALQLEQAARPLLEKPEGEFITQAEMNERASENLELAKARMVQVLAQLKQKLDHTERDALSKAQMAWESYCIEQAEAAAISYRGGTIYPLIFLTEIERLTVDRAARLQADLDEIKSLNGEP